jgi:alkanesulfonate monooxygenase SsuD/methylene tetrahydromethanopterin reductase-like flavin-dependent oxidoreductase (luciferase family)
VPLIRQAVAAPCFGDDPAAVVDLAVAAEKAGYDGFFVWDHLQFTNEVSGPDVLDPWALLAVVASRTYRVRLGPMVTPVSRRRPWVLAKQCVTIDRLSNGRLTLGVGLGSPAHGDFGRFGDAAGDRARAELLDEGLAVWAGLCSGAEFAYDGEHYTIAPTRFSPRPVQDRIPVWVGGVLPAPRPLDRAARWDGLVPITYRDGRLVRPSSTELAAARAHVADRRESMDGYDVAVWSELVPADQDGPALLAEYAAAGATWWIETALPRGNWHDDLRARIDRGPIRPA